MTPDPVSALMSLADEFADAMSEADQRATQAWVSASKLQAVQQHRDAARAALQAAIEEALGQHERMNDALQQIKTWSLAYPLSIFPEPDFAKAHEALTAAGMTLDAISASNMRHVITRVQAIADAALPAPPALQQMEGER